jgi:hypothetical protein
MSVLNAQPVYFVCISDGMETFVERHSCKYTDTIMISCIGSDVTMPWSFTQKLYVSIAVLDVHAASRGGNSTFKTDGVF